MRIGAKAQILQRQYFRLCREWLAGEIRNLVPRQPQLPSAAQRPAPYIAAIASLFGVIPARHTLLLVVQNFQAQPRILIHFDTYTEACGVASRSIQLSANLPARRRLPGQARDQVDVTFAISSRSSATSAATARPYACLFGATPATNDCTPQAHPVDPRLAPRGRLLPRQRSRRGLHSSLRPTASPGMRLRSNSRRSFSAIWLGAPPPS
jgi:hypothetical protein